MSKLQKSHNCWETKMRFIDAMIDLAQICNSSGKLHRVTDQSRSLVTDSCLCPMLPKYSDNALEKTSWITVNGSSLCQKT